MSIPDGPVHEPPAGVDMETRQHASLIDIDRLMHPDELLFDFVHMPYAPRTPVASKLQPVRLLMDSLPVDPAIIARWRSLIEHLRATVGIGRTIWGVKVDREGELSWELYFYDNVDDQRAGLGAVIDALAPYVAIAAPLPSTCRYYLTSVELRCAADGTFTQVGELDVYTEIASRTSNMLLCYCSSDSGLVLKNTYIPMQIDGDFGEVRERLAQSAYNGSDPANCDRVPLEELDDAHTVVMANKQACDGLYFMGIGVHQLVWFLGRAGFPSTFVQGISDRAELLDHVMFDVSYDYRFVGQELEIVKAAFFSSF